jgi:hypothetical protein
MCICGTLREILPAADVYKAAPKVAPPLPQKPAAAHLAANLKRERKQYLGAAGWYA